MAHCPLPRSTELTDLLVDCDTHVLTIIQTAANGAESHQSVDLSCILPENSKIESIDFNCETGQLIITQVTDGVCAGGECTETIIVDLTCLTEGMMPGCEDLVKLGVAPVDYSVVVCTPEGPFTIPPSSLFPSFNCDDLPTVCCPRPPGIGILACNEGDLVIVPPTDLLTCDDIPSVFPPPADFEIVVCGGGGLIKIPPANAIKCADIPVVFPPPDPSYVMLCSEGGMIKIPYDPSVANPPTIDINEGEGIDIDVSINGSHTAYTISSDLCEYPDKTEEDVDNAGSVYWPICIDGGNGKVPIDDMLNLFGGFMVDGHGTALSGDGTPESPHKVDVALCELAEQPYVPAATLAICNGTASERMPAIKAGSNVTIDVDGTLNVAIPDTGPKMASCLLVDSEMGGTGDRFANPVFHSADTYDPHNIMSISGGYLVFSLPGMLHVSMQTGPTSEDGEWCKTRLGIVTAGLVETDSRYPNSEWLSTPSANNLMTASNSMRISAGGKVRIGGWSSSDINMQIGEAVISFIEEIS